MTVTCTLETRVAPAETDTIGVAAVKPGIAP
jgi:hypothetical protein